MVQGPSLGGEMILQGSNPWLSVTGFTVFYKPRDLGRHPSVSSAGVWSSTVTRPTVCDSRKGT